jgi:LmbE family N-acetylglucosaminyl deacetylase
MTGDRGQATFPRPSLAIEPTGKGQGMRCSYRDPTSTHSPAHVPEPFPPTETMSTTMSADRQSTLRNGAWRRAVRSRSRRGDTRRRTLLGVWAHPDDEAYTSAGLMAEFRRRGDRVVVITATLGEHGTSDPDMWPPAALAERRHAELRTSLATLGVEELHVLGYEDGSCALGDGTEAIARHIADVEPDIVVTFGPDGMTGHPDHRAVSRWTTDAWIATLPTAELWYATVTPDFHQRWGPINDQIGLWSEQPEPPSTTAADLARNTRLPDDLLDLKVAALVAHTSQTRSLIEMLGPATFREWWRTESFRQADARVSATLTSTD